jgi:hypothetical protein
MARLVRSLATLAVDDRLALCLSFGGSGRLGVGLRASA